jgi:nitrilase
MAMRVVKAAAVQLSPVLYSREGTVGKVVQKIHELGQQAVQFATFPETLVPVSRAHGLKSQPDTETGS